MKSKELIKRLQEIDPTGETQVMSDGKGCCIIDVDSEPAYWDGPCHYVDDDNIYFPKKYYISDKLDGKIVISTISLEDFVGYKTDIENDILIDLECGNKEFYLERAKKQKEIEHKLRNETIAKFLPKLYDRINNSWKIFHDSDRPIHHYNSSYFKLGTEQKKLCQGETIALLDSGNFELNTETLEWVVKNKWDCGWEFVKSKYITPSIES